MHSSQKRNANSDCALSKYRAAHSRIIRSAVRCVGTIPQSLTRQPPLRKGAFGAEELRFCSRKQPLKQHPSVSKADSSPFRGAFGRSSLRILSPNGDPDKAQRKRVCWGKEEQRSERAFRPKGGNGVHELCDDAGDGR